MSRTVLVLGATGKTGRRLTRRLADQGRTVRAASRASAEARFDWFSPDTFAPAVAGANAVYLVPPAFVEDPTPVVGPFLSVAADAGVSQVVLLSSLGAAFPGEPEDSGRLRLERQVRDSGLDWTILRPSGFFQNFSEGFLLQGILQAGMIVSAAGSGAAALVDAEDIAAVAAAALSEPGHAGRTYAVTGPEALTFDRCAETISQASGRPVRHKAVTPEAFAGVLAGAGLPDDYVAMVLRDQAAIAAGDAAQLSGDVLRCTGRPPRSFESFTQAAVGAWR